MLAEDRKRLAKIDRLYALRLDRHVSLPMLVVVGDQSCGKSSVLEGLTGLPFPRDAELCTRFPTQVVFKRSKEKKVLIRILPYENMSRDGIAGPICDENVDVVDEKRFRQALIEACRKMKLPLPGEGAQEECKSFSKDVLKIELSGPDYEHFSVVDLPGLFRNPTQGLTSKEDMKDVRDMVKSYIGNRRSIILAVVPANVDIATQEIVQMAEDVDASGRRTLGVLTKPDLVDEGAEHKVIELVTSSKSRFALGFTLVCNRSQSKLSSSHQERCENENRFFGTVPWNQVPSNRVGVTALRKSLNKLLIESTRESFADLSQEINGALATCKQNLISLGPPRSSEMTQRIHLLEIATSYQRLTSHALDAYYGRDNCFSEITELRLATRIKRCQEGFSSIMRRNGHTRAFGRRQSPVLSLENAELDSPEDDLLSDVSDDVETSKVDKSIESEVDQGPVCEVNLRLKFQQPRAPEEPPDDSIYEWIRKEYDSSKGFEMGGINPAILPALYYEQIRNWRYHTYKHLHRVINVVHSFISRLIEHLCPDFETATRLKDVLDKPLQDCYAAITKQAEFLLKVEENGNPRTLNHYFAITLNKIRLRRQQRRLEDSKIWVSDDDTKETLLRLSDVLNASVTNESHVVDDLHDILQSYYKVARKQFVDAISKGPVDYLLLMDEKGPLRTFSASFVGSLSCDELAEIAGETEQITHDRTNLQQELERLQVGLEVVQE